MKSCSHRKSFLPPYPAAKKKSLTPSPVAVGLSVSRIHILFVIFWRIFCLCQSLYCDSLDFAYIKPACRQALQVEMGETKAGRKRIKEKGRKRERRGSTHQPQSYSLSDTSLSASSSALKAYIHYRIYQSEKLKIRSYRRLFEKNHNTADKYLKLSSEINNRATKSPPEGRSWKEFFSAAAFE